MSGASFNDSGAYIRLTEHFLAKKFSVCELLVAERNNKEISNQFNAPGLTKHRAMFLARSNHMSRVLSIDLKGRNNFKGWDCCYF